MRTFFMLLIAAIGLSACSNPTGPQEQQTKGCADTIWVGSARDGMVHPVVMCGKI